MVFIIMTGILAFLVGFSSKRAKLCLVRATRDVLKYKNPALFFLILEAMSWALLVTIPAALCFPAYVTLATSYRIELAMFIGGFLFGFGAALNGGCSLGTLNALSSGRLSYAMTIIGMFFGYLLYNKGGFFPMPVETSKAFGRVIPVALSLIFALSLWGILIGRLLKVLRKRKRTLGKMIRIYLRSAAIRNDRAIMVMGLAAGVLFLTIGPWSYTELLKAGAGIFVPSMTFDYSLAGVVAALSIVAGVLAATYLEKGFAWHREKLRYFSIRFFCGSLMGIGAGLVPGGNDFIMLHVIPGLAPHGIFVFAAMIAGIVTGMMIMRSIRRKMAA